MSWKMEKNSLRVALLAGIMGWILVEAPVGAETIKIGGTGVALGAMQLLAETFQKAHPDAKVVIVPGLGSGGGKKALLGGAIDVAVTSKGGKAREKLEGAVAVLYGRSPFVFATAKKNPVSALTTKDIIEIWSGRMTTWPNGQRLRLILRPESDTDTDVLKSISPAMAESVKAALTRPGIKMAVTDNESADAIESTPGALGTSLLALIIAEKRSLKPLLLNGVEGTPKTIADGSYPYFRSLYLMTRRQPSDLARQFVSFVVSARGREILGQLGHWVVEDKAGQ